MTQIGGPLGLIKPAKKSDRFELKIHTIKPEDLEPNGDRYTVEVIDFDEAIELGQILVVTQDANINPRDPAADPRVEQRGVIAGVVIRAGNGHLLGLPDPRIAARQMAGNDAVQRVKADVPMFYGPGDVVLVDRNARGRAVKILGREIRLVNQIDCLARLEGIKLERDGDSWKQV